MSKDFGMTPPVMEGEIYNLTVQGHGKSGDPFDKICGYVIFIKLPEGETRELDSKVKVKITRVTNALGFAELADD